MKDKRHESGTNSSQTWGRSRLGLDRCFNRLGRGFAGGLRWRGRGIDGFGRVVADFSFLLLFE